MRVLVVEDEENLGAVFRDFLFELGHHADVVRSAEAALAHLGAERPDAIILDINLPGMSGTDFLRLRPVREAGLPIVAVSGVVTENQARECLRLGALDFVGKPVPLDRLHEVLTYLEPHALSRQREQAATRAERRRGPRSRVGLPVRIVEYRGTAWAGTCLELGPAGMKLRTEAPLARGAAVKLAFAPPDNGGPIEAIALVARVEADGVVAFTFAHLPASEAERLDVFVRRLQEP